MDHSKTILLRGVLCKNYIFRDIALLSVFIGLSQFLDHGHCYIN